MRDPLPPNSISCEGALVGPTVLTAWIGQGSARGRQVPPYSLIGGTGSGSAGALCRRRINGSMEPQAWIFPFQGCWHGSIGASLVAAAHRHDLFQNPP